MSYHSHTSLLFHCVFSTKDRLPLIPTQIKSRLWSYMSGIARGPRTARFSRAGVVARVNDMKALAVGGVRDHLHVLLSLSPTMAVAKAVQLLKAGSSKWMHDQGVTQFEWQAGYGAVTIGISQVAATTNYILNQEKHHAKKSFDQEWQTFLRRHGLVEHPD